VTSAKEYLQQISEETCEVHRDFMRCNAEKIVEAAALLAKCFRSGGKVLIFGNGGSAADAQHMADELVGRMLVDRQARPALALTTDSSNLTAIGNDYGFDQIFSRQIEGLANPGDVVVAISTSGKSPNVLRGIEAAKQKRCSVIGLTGGQGGQMVSLCDICLTVAQGKNSSRIQESHIFAIHSLVDLVDQGRA